MLKNIKIKKFVKIIHKNIYNFTKGTSKRLVLHYYVVIYLSNSRLIPHVFFYRSPRWCGYHAMLLFFSLRLEGWTNISTTYRALK